MQHVVYPLPPLMLTPIIEQCAKDHTHIHSEWCVEDSEFCSRVTKDNENNVTPFIVEIHSGYGRHECDKTCNADNYCGQCLKHCQNSDWVVTLQYSSNGWWATYGITRHGDIQDIQLWAD
jgi:hypothetical protein